jgi:hypothetical protein
VSGDLNNKVLENTARMGGDVQRAWAIQLATEEAGKSKLSFETLLKLAQTDPLPTVRLALASALPKLDTKTVWEVASALAMHGEDKDADAFPGRFDPLVCWKERRRPGGAGEDTENDAGSEDAGVFVEG